MTTTSGGLFVNTLVRLVLLIAHWIRSLVKHICHPTSGQLADLLVTTAAYVLPRADRERYRKEWLAELYTFRASEDRTRLRVAADILTSSPRVGWTLRRSDNDLGSTLRLASAAERLLRRIVKRLKRDAIIALLIGLLMAIVTASSITASLLLGAHDHHGFAGMTPPSGHLLWPNHVRTAKGVVDGSISYLNDSLRANVAGKKRTLRWASTDVGSALVATWDRPIRLSAVGMIPGGSSYNSRFREAIRRISSVRYSFSDGGEIVTSFQEPGPVYQWTLIGRETTSVRIEILSTVGVPDQRISLPSELRFAGFVESMSPKRSREDAGPVTPSTGSPMDPAPGRPLLTALRWSNLWLPI